MRACALLLAVLGVSSAAAQSVPPALMVEQDGRSVPLGLARLQTEVRIHGAVAETTTTMTFANPLPRAMEGNLYFPLPEGATIAGYALDIQGVMVDGVAVEKHEARRVFEAVVRRGIDPGIVEWTKGNNFQARVFPIPAGGTRTIRVQYVSELVGGKDAPAYHLPLNYKTKVPEFSLRVEVVKPGAAPKVAKGELAHFEFGPWQDSYVAQTRLTDWTPVEDLVISLPKVEGAQVVVEQAEDGQTYFAIHDEPSRPAAELPVAAAHRVVLFWDASGSHAGDNAREIAVVQNYLARLMPGEKKIAVDLVLVRNDVSKPTRIELTPDSLGQLSAALNKVQYDGGTQLGAIGPVKDGPRPDLYLLVTDGLSNFGREEPDRLDAPLVVFSASPSANHALLHGLAMLNGGRYFNLANWKDDDIAAQAGRAAWSYLGAKAEGAKDIVPQLAQPVAGRFTLAGKLDADQAAVSVEYGLQGGQTAKRSFTVRRGEASKGSLLRRLWAQKKLADLLVFEKKNEKEITALGKQYGLVTPYTSLIVLDSLEQYVEHEIEPPKSLAAMRDEYLRRIDTVEHQQKKQKADKVEEVVRLWEQRVKWWEAEYKVPVGFTYRERPAKTEAGGGGGRPATAHFGAAAPAGRPAAPAARAPEPERRQMQERAGEDRAAPAEEPAPVARPAPAPGVAGPATPRGAMRADRYRSMDLAPAQNGRADAKSQAAGLKRSEGAKAEKESEEQDGTRQPGIVIQPWNPDTPYLKELQAAKGKEDLFAVYMNNRAKFGTSPAFFLDCADFFREAGQRELALQVLSNLAELQLEDATIIRVLGYRLAQIGELDLAVQSFERVLEMRPEEPQSCRDLALTLARRAENGKQTGTRTPDGIRDDYRRAIDLLVRVVLTRWDGRFAEVELIALEEVNAIIPKAKEAGVTDVPLDPRLQKVLDVDVRIVMTWQADNTDIDLWVTEPSGEKGFYGHNRTTIGGLVSRDFTGGYGPEEYLVRRAMHGMYKIEANYYGSQATRLLGAVTVQVDVYTNFGRKNQQCRSLTLRLKDAKETVPIGQIEF